MTQLKTGHRPNSAGEEKRTFLPYSRGIQPKDLRVGSLYIDPVNPIGGVEDQRFEYREEIEQDEYEKRISQWCYGEDSVVDFSMGFWKYKNSGVSFSLTELVQLNFSKDKFDETSIYGTAGRRVQLKKPKRFIQDDVLKQEGVDEWLRVRASANRAVYSAFRRNQVSCGIPPPIWVCTGVQMITEGKVYTGKELEKLKEAKLILDASPAVGAPPGTLSAGGAFNRGTGHGTSVEYKYIKEQVWAAEFMELGIVYGGRDQDGPLTIKYGEPKPRIVSSVEIYNTPNLGEKGWRGSPKQEDSDVEDNDGVPHVEETHAHFYLAGNKRSDSNAVGSDEDDEKPGPVEFGSRTYVDQLKISNWEDFNTGMEYLKHKKVPVTSVASAERE